MKTFIRIAEIWVPTKDRMQLEFGGGLYGPLDEFRATSVGMRFGFDEGLPGRAWATGHPVIVTDFEKSHFKRGAVAKAAGLTCGVALPIFAGDFLLAVMVLLCGGGDAHIGAIELWHSDLVASYDLRLADGYFGAADTFEFNARHTKFPRGYGLPGRAWKANMPTIEKDLLNSKSFLRSQQAVEIGINRGLGIPYLHASGHTWVVTFLSALDTPIARRLEIWVPNEARDALIFHSGDCDQNTQLAIDHQNTRIGKQDGIIGRVWLTGIPAVLDNCADDPSPLGRSAAAAGMKALLAMPFIHACQLKAVIAWYF
jgi:GAF domain